MKQLRKSLALLLAVLMLCSVLPMSGLVSAASTNLIKNGDFEAGSSNWTLYNDDDTATEVIDDPTGSGRGKVMHAVSTYNNSNGRDDMFYQQPGMEANTDYVLTFKAYCYSTASNAAFIVNFYDKDGGQKVTYNTSDVTGLACQNIDSSSAVRCRLNVNANTGKWVDVSIPFNSGSAVTSRILFSNYRVQQGYYYFDDIVLTKVGGDEPETPVEPDEPEEPETPDLPDAPADYNMLKNGDFEQGGTNWTLINSSTIATSVVSDPTSSNQGLVMKTDANNTSDGGSGNEMFYQSVSTMSANTDYILKFKTYVYSTASSSPGFWVTLGSNAITYSTSSVTTGGLEVKTVSSSSSTRVRFTATSSSARNKWCSVEIPFNSGDISNTTSTFSNYRANAGQYYFDDVVLVRADGKEEPGLAEPETPNNPEAPVVAGNLVVNGTFETGDTTGWHPNQSTTVNTEAAKTGSYGAYLSGKGSYGSLLYTTVDAVIGKSYVVKLWLKVKSVGVNIQVKETNDSGASLAGKWCSADSYSEWTQISFVVSPTTNALFLNICGAGNGNYEVAYVDDVVITEAPLISNGDFEAGDLSGWEKWQSTTISTNAAYEGNYGVNLKGNGSWGGMLNQNMAVKNGKTYELSFWYKINANGFTLQLQGVQSGTMYMNKSYKSPVGEWTQLVTTVTSSGDTAIKLNFSGIGGSSADPEKAEDVYIDAITLTEQKSASTDGYIINGDFEYTDWTTHWINVNNACTVSLVEGHNSAQALSIKAPMWNQVRQKFVVEPNTDYQLTLWAKNTTDITLILKTGTTDQNYAQRSISAGSTWTEITYTFNSGDNTSLYLGFMGQESGNGAAIIDDIRMVALKDPSFDGYVYNGDFETGVFGQWQMNNSSLSYMSNDAHDGIYAAAVKGVGDWGGHLLYQEITLEAGKTYTLSFWYKPISNGVNYSLRTLDKAVTFDSLYMDSNKVAQWTYHEVTFEAGTATEIEMTFSGSGKSNGINDEVLIDDVRLVNLSGSEMDRSEIAVDKGSSIRDTADGKPALANGFDMTIREFEVVDGTNIYKEGTGSIKLYNYADIYGDLQYFGAVVTNDPAVGNDADTFTLNTAQDGTRTINIKAKYLLTWDAENFSSLSFAVRIINIPDAYVGTEIYFRPYYVYELDGETYTIYGDIESSNYATVELTRRTKRVLTIGEGYTGFERDLYGVLKDADYDQVILANYNNGAYNKNDDNNKWVSPTIDRDDLMGDERWQYIVVNNDADLAWANANKPEGAQVLYYGNDVAVDTALANLATVLPGATDAQKDYTAALTWFLSLTGESLELVEFNEAFSDSDCYNMRRAAAHAWYTPNTVSDLTETVILSGSDFQPNTWDKGIQTLQGLTGSLANQGYGMFDGLLFSGDYTQALGSDYDSSNEGLHVLDDEISKIVNFDRIYGQGNHDAAGIDLLSPYGNNDPKGAPYGVFNIPEDHYNAYGNGAQTSAADLTAYFAEKLADPTWGNKPIFVISHLPLHYNYRTIKDKGASTAKYLVDALNAGADAGLNIIFLFGHNHSGGYDDYLGGAAIYVPKGESILVADLANYKNAPIETELRFTYLNSGYVAYYNNMENGADTALTMTTFKIQANGDVIITRYDKDGEHNLKSAGTLSPYDRDYTTYTEADGRVYESSRIVGANKDEKYED